MAGKGRGRGSRLLAVAIALAGVVLACAHAPPVVGPRDGRIDPDNPEANCAINNTVDCRPPAD